MVAFSVLGWAWSHEEEEQPLYLFRMMPIFWTANTKYISKCSTSKMFWKINWYTYIPWQQNRTAHLYILENEMKLVDGLSDSQISEIKTVIEDFQISGLHRSHLFWPELKMWHDQPTCKGWIFLTWAIWLVSTTNWFSMCLNSHKIILKCLHICVK